MLGDDRTSELDAERELQNYGIAPDCTRWFATGPEPEMLDYLDLIAPSSEASRGVLPDGVVESQGRPLLFFVNDGRLTDSPNSSTASSELVRLRKRLASRGQRVFLAIIRPGSLDVLPVSLTDQTLDWEVYHAGSSRAMSFFTRLSRRYFDGDGCSDTPHSVFNRMFSLLQSGADRLAAHTERADVLSLVGRALFFRFLCDRFIVTDETASLIAPAARSVVECFDTAENAFQTCRWLDKTFNGDFLPLTDGGSLDFFRQVASHDTGMGPLRAIARRNLEPVGADDYQLLFDWNVFDFAHVPVGLLSQVYEAFCWKWDPTNARETSVHYTPRDLASMLVDEAFESLPDAGSCRALDPACGAGIFLVLAFRRLYREQWQAGGARPGTREIREILENQLTGFDISESALRLAALSLYLTAIELDPVPVPPEKLRFRALRNRVLFDHRQHGKEAPVGPVIGSLGAGLGDRFNSQFDLILTNPPWTSLKEEQRELAAELTNVSREVIRNLGEPKLAAAYENPDYGPDLPFLWKATVWAKPGARIAMALPARVLLKQEEIPRRARDTIFQLIEITAIINGTNLADSQIWPGMNQPFLLLFARNNRPRVGHLVRMVSPVLDVREGANDEIRIDSRSIQTVDADTAAEDPWIWKAIAVGTSLDVEVVRRIHSTAELTLGAYCGAGHLNLKTGTGYMAKPKQKQNDASELHGLKHLSFVPSGYSVDDLDLPIFERKTLFRPRERSLYMQPLLLVKQAPGSDHRKSWALLSLSDVAFNQSFQGYSGAGHEDGELLVRYLQLFAHCSIRIHHALITAPRYGSERRVFDKSDFDDCRIIPLDELSAAQRETIGDLSRRLLSNDLTVFEDIDRFFGKLFRLTAVDLEVIRDTLHVALPYKRARKRAVAVPIPREREFYRQRLETVLQPFFKAIGKVARVTFSSHPIDPGKLPFAFLLVQEASATGDVREQALLELVLLLAKDSGATQIIQRVPGGLLVGLFLQYRFWTRSRARLLAVQIIRDHMQVFQD